MSDAVASGDGAVPSSSTSDVPGSSSGGGLFHSVLRTLVIYFGFLTVRNIMVGGPRDLAGSPGGVGGGTPAAPAVHRCAWEKGTLMDVHVVISHEEAPDVSVFLSSSACLESSSCLLRCSFASLPFGGGVVGGQSSASRSWNSSVPVTREILGNGTVYAHAYVRGGGGGRGMATIARIKRTASAPP